MYKTVYQAAFWTMQRTEEGLPEDLGELLAHLRAIGERGAAPGAAAGVGAAAGATQAAGAAAGEGGQRPAGAG